MVRDPVCGVEVTHAGPVALRAGETLYFCSDECRTQFENNPDHYVQGFPLRERRRRPRGGDMISSGKAQDVEGLRDRVRAHTSEALNARIDEATNEAILAYATRPKEEISRRIDELENEWDVERWLETAAASFALTGAGLGAFVDRRWLLLTGAVAGFLLQHALQGWCPPLEVVRRLGVRTRQEIDRELYALKTLRGDFDSVSSSSSADSLGRANEIAKGVKVYREAALESVPSFAS